MVTVSGCGSVFRRPVNNQEKCSLRSRSCSLSFGYYGLALVNQISDFDSCLTGVPPRTTFADYESTFSKPRIDKKKLRICQTTKTCLTAAGAIFQNYESEFPDYEQKFSDHDGAPQPGIFRLRVDQKSSYETKIRVGKEQPRNYEARWRTVRCVFLETRRKDSS